MSSSKPTAAKSNVQRIRKGLEIRVGSAQLDAETTTQPERDNGDEARYSDKCGTYTKAVRQAAIGRVDLAAYKTFQRALHSGDPADFERITLGGARTLNGPQGGLAYQMACLDSSQFWVPPAPTLDSEAYATELVEMYWASLLRDVAFSDYATNPIAALAAAELSAARTYAGPRNATKQVTPDLLFRGAYPGETIGPYLSQFLLLDTSLGALPVTQRYATYQPGIDFMLDETTFQQVQNGQPTGQAVTNVATPLYLHDGRGLGAYTHVDMLYEAYLTAYLVLSSLNVPLNPGNPYQGSITQNGFATFGSPDISTMLAMAASAAIKAVWYHKWYVHLRHRPESGGAIVHLNRTQGYGSVEGKLHPSVLHSNAVETSFKTNKSYFLSQAFPEGSPTHPAYPTGHGTVAGACITILKFFFDGSFVIPNPVTPAMDGTAVSPYQGADAGSLTVNGELNKLAHNISFAHGIHSGIHWRSDTDTSIELGEAVALSMLQDMAVTYNEKFSIDLQQFNGNTVTLSNENLT